MLGLWTVPLIGPVRDANNYGVGPALSSGLKHGANVFYEPGPPDESRRQRRANLGNTGRQSYATLSDIQGQHLHLVPKPPA